MKFKMTFTRVLIMGNWLFKKYNDIFDMLLDYNGPYRIPIPYKVKILLDKQKISISTLLAHGWSQTHHSDNIILNNRLTFIRTQFIMSTDCILGAVGFTKGLHVWEIIWPIKYRGTHAGIGVGTINTRLQVPYYTLLMGDGESYGWDICNNILCTGISYPNTQGCPIWKISQKILIILDMDAGTLSYMVDDKYLGIAFTGLQNKELYPMVSTVWGNCTVTINYIGCIYDIVPSLKSLCRYEIRKNKLSNTGLPKSLIQYLK